MRAVRCGVLLCCAAATGCGPETADAPNQAVAPNAVIANAPIAIVTNESDGPKAATPSSNLNNKPFPVPRETGVPGRKPHKRQAEYRAIGTEPFWAVAVSDDIAMLERPDRETQRFVVSGRADARSMRYLGDGFTMTVSPGPCSDGMSDRIWSDRVQIAFGEGILKGCGGQVLEPEPERFEAQ